MDTKNTKTISVTMWSGQAKLLKDASEKLDISLSEFIRIHTVPAAARELGMSTPDFPSFDSPHYRRGAISLAAESLGLTPEQFKQRMAEQAAQAVLQEHAKAAQKMGHGQQEIPQPRRRSRRATG